MIYLGIDLGGTFIKHGALDPDGRILREGKQATSKSLDDLNDQVTGIISEYQNLFSIRAVGIGIAGFIRKGDGCIVKSPNMPFLDGICFHDLLGHTVRIPVVLENDANLIAWGEYCRIPEPRPDSFIHITLGTGLGGGIILNGRIWRGEEGFAGELGHVVVNPDGRMCGCGSRGCVETESTATGIMTGYRELGGDDADSALQVYEKAVKGHPQALKSIRRAGYYLGIFLTSVINMLNPAEISIGGGVASAGDILFDPALAELKMRVNPVLLSTTRINFRKDSALPAYTGAAKFAQLLTSV